MKFLHLTSVFLLLHISLMILPQVADAQSTSILTGEKREALLQGALALRAEENYSAAMAQLDSILQHKKDDAQILLLKGDISLQAKEFGEAVKTYLQLLPLNFEPTITQINLSYALFMNHKPAKALQYAKAAWEQSPENKNAIVNHFNALLWNTKTKEAAVFLAEQESKLAEDQVWVMKARLQSTSGNYRQGFKHYQNLVDKYPNKHYVQEYAEVLLGKKEVAASQKLIEASEKLFSENEYLILQEKIQPTQFQSVGTEFVFFEDIGDNIRIENSVYWQQKEDSKYRISIRAGLSSITAPQSKEVNSKFAGLTIRERWNATWSGQTDINLQNVSPSEGENNSYTAVTAKQFIKFQPTDRRMFGAFVSTDVLNFTASLLESNIRLYNLGYVTHLMMDGKNGFYSEGSYGLISDDNTQAKVFGSFYHLFSTTPLIKAGVNFSALSFKDNSITAYFSPEKYLSTELFADYNTAIPGVSNLFLNTQLAGGFQKIEDGNWETAFRLQTELSLKTKRFNTSLKYQTSDVASNSGAGYRFDWLTAGLVYKW